MTGICLGILEAGHPPAELIPGHGTSLDMFKALLTPADPSIRYANFSVFDDRFPDDYSVCDAWLITGARASVLDPEPWIDRLREFAANAYGAGVPMVGICFGHQLLATALGGQVIRSEKGWGLGLSDYPVLNTADWMPQDINQFAIRAMHEDQVVALPRHAEVIAGSDFCPNAVVAYGDTAISFQGHPEFTAPYARDLIALRRGDLFPGTFADRAIASLEGPTDAGAVAGWIVNFLTAAVARRSKNQGISACRQQVQ